ncbi:MAG: hypothetical protein NC548_12720 [Lachnospiraceae bacterium]|nr:hypothetical protein [Lachnospiraceae bacterium]MCM1230747.1 hypothetical protein [Ruminococcus flavefaciens]
MKCYSLPIRLNEIDGITPENSIILMNELNFPCSPDKQKRSAFLFLRNTNIHASLSFDGCSYAGKCEYMMSYYTDDICVQIPELDLEWLLILLRRANGHQPCKIFTDEEGDRFIKEHKDFIDEVLRLIISLPLCSIQYFLADKENVDTDISIDSFPKSDWDKLNMNNFIHLLDHEEILWLINPVDDLKPTFYSKYFFTEGNPYIQKMVAGLPFLALLNAMMYNAGDAEFAEQLGKILDKEVTENNG